MAQVLGQLSDNGLWTPLGKVPVVP